MAEMNEEVRAYFRALGTEGGRKGGKVGGPARWAKLSEDERRQLIERMNQARRQQAAALRARRSS